MENQSKCYPWSAVRVEAVTLFTREYSLNKAKRDLRELKKNLRALLENKDGVRAEIDDCKCELSNSNNPEERVQLRKKLAEDKASKENICKEISAAREAISAKESEVKNEKAARKVQKSSLQDMLRGLKSGRWTVLMGVADMCALRVMKDLNEPLKLTFTIGRSVTQDVGDTMNKMMSQLSAGKFEELCHMKLYELTANGRFRQLRSKECERLGFHPKATN